MLYIMRHGQTDWNAIPKLQGRTDIPLNEQGRAGARRAAEACAAVHFDVCYCSPLVRARETAEIVLRGRSVPIIPDDRLIEMDFGAYEGVENYRRAAGCPINVIFAHPERYTSSIGGAERFDELFARTGDFLKKVAFPALKRGKDVLIVGHGAMNSSIVCQIRGLPIEQFWSAEIEHCKLTRLI